LKTALIIIFLSFLTLTSVSQYQKSISASLYAGGYFPNNGINTGFNIGTDLEHITNKFGLYINFAFNFTKRDNFQGNISDNYGIMEIYAGPRWIIGNKQKLHGTVEAGIGSYSFYSDYLRAGSAFGLNIAAGISIPLSEKINFNVKGRYHILGKDYFTTYGSLYGGVRFYFMKN